MLTLKTSTVVSCVSGLIMGLMLTQQAAAGSILDDCSAEIESYCSEVTLGDGRLAACMYAHEDKLSDACDAAIDETADQLDWFFGTLAQAVEICAPDIEKFCSNVEFGEGRVYLCLGEKMSELTQGCQKVVEEVDKRLID